MKAVSFKTPAEIVAYVTAEGVVQTDIVAIWWVRGTWWLFHF